MSGQVISGSADPAQMMQRILQEAVAHHQAGRPEQASAGYHALLRQNPDHPDALHLLGVLANEAGNFQRGAALIRRSLVLMPNFPDAHLNLGNALDGLGDFAGARAAYERAIALRPDFLLARLNLAEFLNRHGQSPAAEMHARHALQLAPGLERANMALWQAVRTQRKTHEAVAVMRQVIAQRPGLPGLLSDLATSLAEAGDTDSALTLHRQAVVMAPDHAGILFAYANTLNAAREIAAAVPVLRRVVELVPNHIAGWLTLGWSLRGLGRFEEARVSFQRVLEIDPNQPEAHWNLSLLGREATADAAKETELRAMMHRPGLTAFQQASAGFSLGKMLDDQDRYDEAFTVFAEANAMNRAAVHARGLAFSAAGFTADIDRMIAYTSPAAFTARRDCGVESDLPVFIVGMPRSGTSLVEQIAASHSQVFGAGESNEIAAMGHQLAPMMQAAGPEGAWDAQLTRRLAGEYLARLAKQGGSAIRVIDKTPDNLLFLGMIATLFPGARVVMCARDPRDNCLSHFFQLYTDGNNFSYDLAECGWRARETARLEAHFREVLPIKFLTMQYETLVEDLEGQARRLIEFLGLEWEPACLEFHRTERAVATPNMWGVRQPIYNRQVGRWRMYEKHLGPMLEALDGKQPPG